MDRCDSRTLRECSCAPGTCEQQPKPLPEHHSFDVRFHLSACAIIAVVAGFLAFVSLPRADQHFKNKKLDQQEASVSWK